MQIETFRFGAIEIEDERVLSFPDGLLGFPANRKWILIQTGDDNYFFWLQAVDDPSLAFVVTDPTIFRHNYRVQMNDLNEKDIEALAGMDVEDDNELFMAQTLVICNKLGDQLTANFLGPLIINNIETKQGRQVVLRNAMAGRHYNTREKILDLKALA